VVGRADKRKESLRKKEKGSKENETKNDRRLGLARSLLPSGIFTVVLLVSRYTKHDFAPRRYCFFLFPLCSIILHPWFPRRMLPTRRCTCFYPAVSSPLYTHTRTQRHTHAHAHIRVNPKMPKRAREPRSPRCCPALSLHHAPNNEAPNPREEQMASPSLWRCSYC